MNNKRVFTLSSIFTFLLSLQLVSAESVFARLGENFGSSFSSVLEFIFIVPASNQKSFELMIRLAVFAVTVI